MGRPKKQQSNDGDPRDTARSGSSSSKKQQDTDQQIEENDIKQTARGKVGVSGYGSRSKKINKNSYEQSDDSQQIEEQDQTNNQQVNSAQLGSNKKGKKKTWTGSGPQQPKKTTEEDKSTSDISEFQQIDSNNQDSELPIDTTEQSRTKRGKRSAQKSKKTGTTPRGPTFNIPEEQQTVEENPEEQNDGFQQLDLEDYKKLLSKNQLNNLKSQQTPQIVQFDIQKEEDRILPYSSEQILSKFEYVNIFTHRVQQLEQNMDPLVDNKDSKGNFKSIENIVKEEMAQKKLPIVFERKLKSKIKLYNLQDMIILNNHFNEN